MAIKTRTSRDTYRSNVKKRPLQQNGLEAQYQGLDISEVNIDHAGLAIIGRGGFQTRRDLRKVRKQYIVDVPAEEFNPTAELIYELDQGTPTLDRSVWGTRSLQGLDGETFVLTDQDGTAFTFEYSIDPAFTNGSSLANTNIAINIVGNEYSFRELMFATTGSIESKFPEGTFRFETYPSGSQQMVYGQTEPVTIIEDKIKIILSSSATGGNASLTSTSDYFDTTTNEFGDQDESHEWRLNGFIKDPSNERMFYEDIRTDTIQSTDLHSVRRPGSLFRGEGPQINYDGNIGRKDYAGIAGDPTTKTRLETHDSTEVLIRQYPKREEIFDTYRGNHEWREDIHYLAPDQQTWSRMDALATNYHASLEAHIGAMMDSNFADEQYIDPNPMSGRVDVFKRLSRIFDTHTELMYERHPYSVFDQFLDPIDNFANLQENRYPKNDDINNDAAFEDVQGTRQGEKAIWNDYFDQPPLENHDFTESERWSRIDSEMLDILTFNANRETHIDRREWQKTDYVYTATGFINSQTSGQDGIIYREMKR